MLVEFVGNDVTTLAGHARSGAVLSGNTVTVNAVVAERPAVSVTCSAKVEVVAPHVVLMVARTTPAASTTCG